MPKMQKIDFLRVIFMWSLLQYGQSSGEDDLLARDSGNPSTSDNDNNNNKETTSTEEQVTSPITIVEVRREIVSDGVQLTVKYKYDANGLTIAWVDMPKGSRRLLDHTDISLSDGTRESSAIVPLPERGESPSIVLATFLESNGNGLKMKLSSAEGDDIKRDISLPILKSEPSGEFVYQDGQDFSFTMTYSPEGNEDDGMRLEYDSEQFQHYLLDVVTGQQKMAIGMSDLLERVGNQSFPAYQEWHMKLKTSEKKYSGILVLSTFKLSQRKADLVKELWLFKSVSVRPSSQAGPFPSGYLDFIVVPWTTQKELDDGTKELQVICYRESLIDQCHLLCLAAGDDISDTKIYRVESDGTKTPVSQLPQFTEIVFQEFPDSLLLTQVFFPVSTAKGKESDRFSCVAENAMGKTASIETVVYYYTPPCILVKGSGIQISNMTEGSMTIEVKVMCRVKGYPRPKVTFDLYTLGTSEDGTLPDEITEEGDDVITAVKFVTYDPSDPYGFNGGMGKLRSASCKADIGSPYHGYDSYNIPISAEDL